MNSIVSLSSNIYGRNEKEPKVLQNSNNHFVMITDFSHETLNFALGGILRIHFGAAFFSLPFLKWKYANANRVK